MEEEQGNWVVFERDFDGSTGIILVNLSPGPEVPDPDRPLCISVGVAFKTAGPEGLPEAPELEDLAKVEDAIAEALQAGFDARLVGALALNGERRWCFYAKAAADAQSAAQKAVSALGPALMDYTPEVSVLEDPYWSAFNKNFLPDEREHRAALDMSVINALAEAGDQLDRPRQIEHCAFLPSEAGRDSFCDWAKSNGFTIDERGEADDDGVFAVLFSHEGPALPESITEMTCLATEGAELFEGMYDGWQCRIVRADD